MAETKALTPKPQGVGMVSWATMENMPEDRKDGRKIMLAHWDGAEWEYLIAEWRRKGVWTDGPIWLTTEIRQIEYELDPSSPEFWADISDPRTAPLALGWGPEK